MEERAERCVVCRGALQPLGQRKGATYAACRTCGGVQMSPLPTEAELMKLYEKDYHAAGHYDLDPELSRRHRQNICRYVARLVASLHPPDDPRPVLELGAGWGTLGLALQELGATYWGVEPSATMSSYSLAQGLEVKHGGLETVEQDPELAGRLRAIVTMSVYEHLPDQLGTLRRLAKLLPPDGAIVIQCPTASVPRMVGRFYQRFASGRELPEVYGFFCPPWHVSFPTIQGLRIQAGQCGLVLESVAASPSGRLPDWKLRALQILQETVARAGHSLFGESWPFSMCHVFVLRPKPVALSQSGSAVP